MSGQTLIAALKSELEMTLGEIDYLKTIAPNSSALEAVYERADRLRGMLTDAETCLGDE